MTTSITEADLEARIRQVVHSVFPFLAPDDIEHQTRFQLNLGHTPIIVDGKKRYTVGGRADVIISSAGAGAGAGKALLLLELKRPGVALSEDDAKQGLSYARLLTPMPPLVMLSNGEDTRLYLTQTGEQWVPSGELQVELAAKLQIVGTLAESDLANAVEVLMGVDANWVSGLQTVTAALIDARSGDWDKPLQPFVRDFLIPRKATAEIEATLQHCAFVALSGVPLSGKSSVLREYVERRSGSASEAVLLLESGESGLFQTVANLLADQFGWEVSADRARDWLRTLSKRSGVRIVLAIDGFHPSHSRMASDINELAAPRYGNALGVVVALDDTTVDAVTMAPSKREASAFGRRAVRINIEPLDDQEFDWAKEVLHAHRVEIARGGHYVKELREPWVLRALVPVASLRASDAPSNAVVRLPPVLDIESLGTANEFFSHDTRLLVALDAVAAAVLEYYQSSRSASETIQGLGRYLVPQSVLLQHLDANAIQDLNGRGFIKPGFDWQERPVWWIRFPLLMAARIAIRLSNGRIWEVDASQQLVAITSRLPLGALVAARALYLRIEREGGEVMPCIQDLLADTPRQEEVAEGKEFLTEIQGSLVRAKWLSGRRIELRAHGQVFVGEVESDEDVPTTMNVTSWMILSYFSCLPLAVQVLGQEEVYWLDVKLIDQLARSPCILMPVSDVVEGVPTHPLEDHGAFVCHLVGIVEPITWALHNLLLRNGPALNEWIEEIAKGTSLPLLSRASIALQQLRGLVGERGVWAGEMLEKHIGPAISATHRVEHGLGDDDDPIAAEPVISN